MSKKAPKKTGDKSFMQFITSCVMNDWIVLTPIGDCDRFDCVIDRGNGLEKIQVKSGRLKKGSIRFNTCSTHYHTKQGQLTHCFKKSYIGEIDAFGVYCPDTHKCYLVPIALVGKVESCLRVDPVNVQNSKIPRKWAKDFVI